MACTLCKSGVLPLYIPLPEYIIIPILAPCSEQHLKFNFFSGTLYMYMYIQYIYMYMSM